MASNATNTGFDRYNEGPVVGMTNGMNNLPANAAGNCMLEVLATNNTVQGGFANYHNAWETEVTDRGQNFVAQMEARSEAAMKDPGSNVDCLGTTISYTDPYDLAVYTYKDYSGVVPATPSVWGSLQDYTIDRPDVQKPLTQINPSPVGPRGGGNTDNFGIVISSIDVGIGVYSNYLYNHNTYVTTKGIEKNIFKANGAVRSAQAAKYAGYSKFLKGIGTGASILSTGYSGYKVVTGQGNGMDKMDLSVGVFGLGAGAAASFGAFTGPVGVGIGIGVGVYSGARLLGDVIGDYNPGGSGVGQFYDSSTGTYMIK